MKKLWVSLLVVLGIILITWLSLDRSSANNHKDDVELSQLIGSERPYKIEVWSGLVGDLLVYESEEEIEAFLEIVSDESFVYMDKPLEAAAGCDMAVTLYMDGNNIQFIYFGEVFQLYRNEDRMGIGPYYKIKDPYLNAADIHDYTGLEKPIGYDLD